MICRQRSDTARMEQGRRPSGGLNRRGFLKAASTSALLASSGLTGLAACGGGSTPSLDGGGGVRTLRILQWVHFVPEHDTWFDELAATWGAANGVDVQVTRVALADLPERIRQVFASEEPFDIIETQSPPSNLEPYVLDLADVAAEARARFGEPVSLCQRSSYNPVTDVQYGLCHGWSPDPGNFRTSLWTAADMPQGPASWQQLLDGGRRIRVEQGTPLGIGMARENDSNYALRALLWSFGASVQDASGAVAINSPATVEAVEFMKQLYTDTMTDEVFGWTPPSNNTALLEGRASYVVNPISAYRTAQINVPAVATDIAFRPALAGPTGIALACQAVIPVYVVPRFAQNPNAAKDFMLHLVENYSQVIYHSKLYTFPAYPSSMVQLTEDDGWLDADPFGSTPISKLAVLKNAESWSTTIGHPGPANAAIGEVFDLGIIPQMMAYAARGEMTSEQAGAWAEAQIAPVFERWRAEGLL